MQTVSNNSDFQFRIAALLAAVVLMIWYSALQAPGTVGQDQAKITIYFTSSLC